MVPLNTRHAVMECDYSQLCLPAIYYLTAVCAALFPELWLNNTLCCFFFFLTQCYWYCNTLSFRCITSPWVWEKCWTVTGWPSPCITSASERTWRKKLSASSHFLRNRYLLTQEQERWKTFLCILLTSWDGFHYTRLEGDFSCLLNFLQFNPASDNYYTDGNLEYASLV